MYESPLHTSLPPNGWRRISQRFDGGTCQVCGGDVDEGEIVDYDGSRVAHPDCLSAVLESWASPEFNPEPKPTPPIPPVPAALQEPETVTLPADFPVDWGQVQWLSNRMDVMISTRPDATFPLDTPQPGRGSRRFWRVADVMKFLETQQRR